MAKMIFDEEGILEEPCLSCNKAYTDVMKKNFDTASRHIGDIWYEWCCDEKECLYGAESEDEDD